ncbi:MAG: tetratricopeptide repeat protein [Candidatus Omnitrophota bacterium]
MCRRRASSQAVRRLPTTIIAIVFLSLWGAAGWVLASENEQRKAAEPVSGQSAKMLFESGSREATQRRFDLARQDLTESLSKDPLNHQAHYRLGLVYLQQDELPRAIDSFESAIALGLREARVYYVYGSACAAYGENGKAAKAYQEAIKLDPNMVNACHDLGLLYLKTGDIEKAIAAFEKALAIKKDLPKTLLAIGIAHIRSGKTENVMEYITSLRGFGQEEKAVTLENLLRGSKASQALKPEPDATNLIDDTSEQKTSSRGGVAGSPRAPRR